jgi:hypothetical protein
MNSRKKAELQGESLFDWTILFFVIAGIGLLIIGYLYNLLS